MSARTPETENSTNEDAHLRVLSSLTQVPADVWDSVANPGWQRKAEGVITHTIEGEAPETAYNPFLSHAFLEALEQSGCATLETGWMPRHLILETAQGEVWGAVPAYLKNHSQGEYVFDHGWADAFYRAGGEYYPKIQVCVPFTPATGRRFLLSPHIHQESGYKALASGLIEIGKRSGASSVHATFTTEDEWDLLGEAGYLQRTDKQFHFENNNYADFDAFLQSLASRKRKAIKKERREALSAGLTVEWLTGSDLTEEHWDAFYTFYLDTGGRKWGTPYLNRTFFSLIGERMANDILLIMAKRDGEYIAGALNFIGSDTLFGRNWGCTEHHPYLHFEICYYQAIEFAIQRGLKSVEAGAQGEHKLARGYLPKTTYSAHWIDHPGLREAVAHFLTQEREMVDQESSYLSEHAPFKKTETGSD